MARNRRMPAATPEQAVRAFMDNAPHRVAVLVFPEASTYDAAVVAEVYSTTNNYIRRTYGINAPAYSFEMISSVAGPVTMEMGMKVLPDRWIHEPPVDGGPRLAPGEGIDTLYIAAGCWDPVELAMNDKPTMAWIRSAHSRVGRLASMCTGAFLLAEAGVLDGPATTHWAHCDRLRQHYPKLDVRPDNIFVKSGNVYTSAGSTAAMDLALALVEEDLGHKTAMEIARRLVMFLKRPGGQSQFSSALQAQTTTPDALGGVPEWIINHLDADLSVEALAAKARISPRNFARVFAETMGLTPAKYVERARLEKARMLMEDTDLPVSVIAGKAGFEDDRQMRRAFQRWLKVTPSDYLERFRGAAAANATIVNPPRRSGGEQPMVLS